MMKCLVIVNPMSGRKEGLRLLEKVKSAFINTEISLEVFVSEHTGHINKLAQERGLSDFFQVIIIGGDGTLYEFVNGMMARGDGVRIPIGMVPAGTGNSLMHDLGLLDPDLAIQSILKIGSRRIDLARISCSEQTFYSFNVVGWGLPSTINQKSEKWKLFGGQRYNIASLQEIIRNPNWAVKIQFDGKTITGNYSFFMACNTIHTGKGMKVAPSAKLDDGLIDIILLKKASRSKLIRLFSKIFKGEHIGDPLVEYFQCKHFSLSDGESEPLILDGQVEGRTPFEVTVLQGGLEICNVT